jgi:hypothetical protein
MNPGYEERIRRELLRWESDLLKPPSVLERTAKTISRKINEKIPEKVHQAITNAVKGIVTTAQFGVNFTPKQKLVTAVSLEERDRIADELLSRYKKIAAAEGAGTGAGGILLGAVDFPALIAIKLKFLYDLSHIYGYSTDDYRQRMYLLFVFQLAFSGQDHKRTVWLQLQRFHRPEYRPSAGEIDWETFQQEYRDSIDFRKMLQMIPGIGAVVGAWANYGLLEELGVTAKNCFRYRYLNANST